MAGLSSDKVVEREELGYRRSSGAKLVAINHKGGKMAEKYVLAIHGGAGTINKNTDAAQQAAYHAGLQAALQAGQAILAQGGSAQAAVVAAVVVLEDCPLFNAGRGAVMTADGLHEMDASVMDGRDLSAGAVAAISRIKNPVLLAQAVKQDGRSVFLCGAGAERFARSLGLEEKPFGYFSTRERMAQLQALRKRENATALDHDVATNVATNLPNSAPIQEGSKMGTVGAVARDQAGNLAAATSTGGMTNKRPGRIGDSPIIGAGCYADNQSVAVSCTGTGEHFIRTVLAHQIAARIKFGGQTLLDATQAAVYESLVAIGGRGGLIAIDAKGNLQMPFNTSGMYRAWWREGEAAQSAIFATD